MFGRPFRAAFSQLNQGLAAKLLPEGLHAWGAAVLLVCWHRRCSEAMKHVQATAAGGRRAFPAVLLALTLAGTACSLAACGNQNPVMTPVGWWHDLQGGEIAATRPPPPGADLPYPKLGTIPPKPVLPSNSFRDTVRDQLANERDDSERQAARHPIETVLRVPPPPPPQPAVPAADTANATLPGADAPPPKQPAATPAVAATALPADGGPVPGTPVTLAGALPDTSGLPPIPEAPPAPATFEGVAAQPAPSLAPPLPVHAPRGWLGSPVLFGTNSAVLDPSQNETLKDIVAKRGKGHIEVEGHGDAQADSPDAQQAAITLALKRAQAIADALQKMHVLPESIRLSATAFGRGAALRDAS